MIICDNCKERLNMRYETPSIKFTAGFTDYNNVYTSFVFCKRECAQAFCNDAKNYLEIRIDENDVEKKNEPS